MGEAMNVQPNGSGDMKLNLNNYATVTMQPEGVRILKEYWRSGFPGQPVEEALDLMYPTWRTGAIRIQLWEMCQIFGPHMKMGMVNPLETDIEVRIPSASANQPTAAESAAPPADTSPTA